MSELRRVQPAESLSEPQTDGAAAGLELSAEVAASVRQAQGDGMRQRPEAGSLKPEAGTRKAEGASQGPADRLTPSTLPVTRGEASGLVRPAGRPTDIVAFEEAVVTYFVEAAEVLGVPKSVAAIYGICFASPQPLSFSEINERLDISSGSVSQGLRVLKEVGALTLVQTDFEQKVTKRTKVTEAPAASLPTFSSDQIHVATRGSARERYTPDLELRNLVLHWIETRLQAQLKSGQDRMEAILAAVPAGAPGEARRARLEHLQSWQNKARALLPVMKTFLKLG